MAFAFLVHFLMRDAIKNPDKLVPYTQEMSTEMDELLSDVVIDE